jgi:molecular chaperone GrpE
MTKKQKSKKAPEIENLKKELDEMTETAKRAMADMQNLRRRIEEERSQIFTMATAETIKEMLPILDNIELALKHTPKNIPKDAQEWLKGLNMSLNKLKEVFKNLGLTPIESLNQPFNPDLHEAIAEGPGKENTVIEEFEKGYRLRNHIIRHAKVKVGNGKKQ